MGCVSGSLPPPTGPLSWRLIASFRVGVLRLGPLGLLFVACMPIYRSLRARDGRRRCPSSQSTYQESRQPKAAQRSPRQPKAAQGSPRQLKEIFLKACLGPLNTSHPGSLLQSRWGGGGRGEWGACALRGICYMKSPSPSQNSRFPLFKPPRSMAARAT